MRNRVITALGSRLRACHPRGLLDPTDKHWGGFRPVPTCRAVAAFPTGECGSRCRLPSQKADSMRAWPLASHEDKQLDALYSVFSEITETLSLTHVVQAALRQTMQLMNAHGAVIWLLKEKQLVSAGSLTSEGKPVRGIEARPLGDGSLDRTAKRRRTKRIDDSIFQGFEPDASVGDNF